MANLVIASDNKAMPKLDGSIRRKVYDFFEKLNANENSPALHIEPLNNSLDGRVRTGRVDLQYRAILFRVEDKPGNVTFLYMGTWPHDEAITLAQRYTLRVNPVNGVLEGIVGELEPPADVAPASQAPQSAPSFLSGVGFTLGDLTDKLGLDPVLARQALVAVDDYALTDVAAKSTVGWQGSALLDLATGQSIDDIREKYAFSEQPIDTELDEDEQILQALEHPSTKMQFAYVTDDAELRRIIEGGSFAAWRTFLHPEQRKYVEANRNGAFRLSGGAGTGKTVVAIHRARHLAHADPTARIILTTYNATLAQGLDADLTALDPDIRRASQPGNPGICVRGIDALGKAILDHADDQLGEASKNIFGKSTLEYLPQRTRSQLVWRDVAHNADPALGANLANAVFLENEYVAVVLANKVTTLEQYAKVPRPGRGVRLSRPQRIAVWRLVEDYRRRSQMDNTISFPELLALAAEYLRLRALAGRGHVADHVIVDEAQDLHATHWALLRALVGEGPNDLFISEDSHQRIYGQPIVLSRFGIKIVGRSRRLTFNYRTTAQNLNFAVGILSGADYTDLEQEAEDVSGYRSARTGPRPELHRCASQTEELDRAAAQIKGWLADGVEASTVAVLTRSQDDRDRFVRGLGERGVDARALDRNVATAGHPQVLTMHRSKGMEFSRVILAGIDDKHLPSAATLRLSPVEEHAEALLRERSLLYVASSRARDELVVTWSGNRSDLLGTVPPAS